MKKELNTFLAALMFYTRIPVKSIKGYSDELLNRSTRYFTLIGIIVGGAAALVFWACSLILPVSLAVILSMVATIFITGAFHEDGFADFCDGFGGGYTTERILEIMKDSRIGSFGATGLIFILLVKFFALSGLAVGQIPFMLITGHALSRLMPVLMIYTLDYARKNDLSKSKPVGKAGSTASFLIALVFGLAPLSIIPLLWALQVLPILLIVFFFFRRYIKRKTGGYTGDILGALQQLSEVVFYISMVAFQNSGTWNFF